MNDVAHMFLGAALVTIGIVVAAVADRIRGLRSTRERVPRTSSISTKSREASTTPNDVDVQHEVIGALVTAGYPKRVVIAATAGCTPDQRMTVESWTRASLAALHAGGGVT